MRLPTVVASAALILTWFAVAQADDWPQWRGPERDGVWREAGLIEEFAEPQLELAWSAPVAGGYSGPTVADGRVYVSDRLDDPDEVERVHCFDAKTGEPVWSHSYACVYEGVSYKTGPRAAVLVEDGLAYSLGTMGHLFCFDAASGEVRWKKDLGAEYEIVIPGWGIAATPIIHEELLIVPACGAQDNYLVAFDRKTGEQRWSALSDRGNYSSPILIEHGGEPTLVCWTGDRIVGVDPAKGTLVWEQPFAPKNMPLGVADPILHGDLLYFSGFYDGSLLLQLDHEQRDVKQLWKKRGQSERNTQALHSIISTPLIQGEHIYGVDSYGELRCLELATGERVWEDKTAVPRARWATIFFVPNGERVWMFNDRGELIIARLSAEGFEELDRAQLIEPTRGQLERRDGVAWSHPAFANGHVFARNDERLVCASLLK